MCGIYGAFMKQGEITPHIYNLVKEIGKDLEHRGPDNQSLTIFDNIVAMGHNRLSIIDIEGGNQPFIHKGHDGLVSIANGEIYNYEEIVGNIIQTKEIYLDTGSDCEVIAPIILKYLNNKEDTHAKPLRGMYASAIYNGIEQELILTRDRFGEKPLYKYENERVIVFSSEVKPLARALKRSINDVNLNSISDILTYGYSIGNKTIFSDIENIEPGSIVQYKYRRKDSKVTRYISHEPIKYRSKQEVKEEIIEYIMLSARSDVPICTGLSGGIDSCLINSLLKNKIDKAYTVSYESKSGGSHESEEARKAAEYLNIKHKVIEIKNHDVPTIFIEQCIKKDTPIVDIAGIGYARLYQEMALDGFKVALMGHGGDELYFGYPWLFDSYQLNKQRTNNNCFLYETQQDFRVFSKMSSYIFKKEIASELRWDSYRVNEKACSRNNDTSYTNTFNMVHKYWLEPNSLKMGDSLSMAYGVESRHPLLNWALTEILSEAPEENFNAPKQFLKGIISEVLPETLIQKNKKYFSPPYMHYYKLIDNNCRGKGHFQNKYLDGLGVFSREIMRRFYNKGFQGDAFDYYLFPRLATLQYWMMGYFEDSL